MQKITSKIITGKDNNEVDKKQKAIQAFNQWLNKIAKALNPAQLSNHK
jgi:hypothetical protein